MYWKSCVGVGYVCWKSCGMCCELCILVVCDGHEHVSGVALLHFLRHLYVGPS